MIIIVIIIIIIAVSVFIARSCKNRNHAKPMPAPKKSSSKTLEKSPSEERAIVIKESNATPSHFDRLRDCVDKATDNGAMSKSESDASIGNASIINSPSPSYTAYDTHRDIPMATRSPTRPVSTRPGPNRNGQDGRESALNSLRSLEDLMDEYMKQLQDDRTAEGEVQVPVPPRPDSLAP